MFSPLRSDAASHPARSRRSGPVDRFLAAGRRLVEKVLGRKKTWTGHAFRRQAQLQPLEDRRLLDVAHVDDSWWEEDDLALVTVWLEGDPGGPATVDYHTVDGTAVAGEDYEAASGTLHFDSTNWEAWAEITIINDSLIEEEETFEVHLSNPTGGLTIGQGIGTQTIFSEDPNTPPTAMNDEYGVVRDGVLDVAAPGVLENDSDVEGHPLTAHLLDNPTEGTLEYFNSDGSFRYIPATGFVGVDSFDYLANDGYDDTPATVTIDVFGEGERLNSEDLPRECACECT